MEYLFAHTSGAGGLLDLLCTKGRLLMDAKMFSGYTKYHKFLLSPKINLFGLHKIAWFHGNPSGTVAGSFASRPKIGSSAHSSLVFSTLKLI